MRDRSCQPFYRILTGLLPDCKEIPLFPVYNGGEKGDFYETLFGCNLLWAAAGRVRRTGGDPGGPAGGGGGGLRAPGICGGPHRPAGRLGTVCALAVYGAGYGGDTMGEVLCDETLPGGTRVVCYWRPDHTADPEAPGDQDARYEKHWAIHQGDRLLRFAAEYSGYEGGYGVTPFSNVLDQNGFCVEAPRGAAYTAHDYYVFDETGVPRLLMGCSNDVLERDVNGDGVTELIWNYHGGQFVTCAFLRDGTVYQVEMMSLLAERLPIVGLPFGDLENWGERGLPVKILVGGWAVIDESGPETWIEGDLRLTEDALELYVPQEQVPLEAWAGELGTGRFFPAG